MQLELYDGKVNYKMLTNRYLKALWLKDSDKQQTVEDLNLLRQQFTEITGVTNTYRHAKLELELGDCLLSLNRKQQALE
jgi:hypothetical protein